MATTRTSGCQIKRGFFILRTCQRPQAGVCPDCKRAICKRHLAQHAGQALCMDCAAKRNNDTAVESFTLDEGWSHRYRHTYASTYSYSPLDLGGSSDSFSGGGGGQFGGGGASGGWDEGTGGFDRSDASAFAPGAAGTAADPDADGPGGVFDS